MSRSLLELPKFDLARWYVTKRTRALDLGFKPTHHETMGHAIHMVATKLLTDGFTSHYPSANPNLDPQDRFWMYHLKPGQTEYMINDNDLEIIASLPKSFLEDPSFDLVTWYNQYLDESDQLKQRYAETHLRNYEFKAMTETNVVLEELDTKVDRTPDSVNEVMPEVLDQEDTVITRLEKVLNRCQPFPGDEPPIDPTYTTGNADLSLSYGTWTYWKFMIKFKVMNLISIWTCCDGQPSPLANGTWRDVRHTESFHNPGNMHMSG